MARLDAAAIDAATPASRDRYVDFLRAASICVVVLGHWLMAVVRTADGRLVGENALAAVPAVRPLTWLLQVMPVFFLVGGFSHHVTLSSPRWRDAPYAEFVASRADRLLRPVGVLLAVWVPVFVVLDVLAVRPDVVRPMGRIVTQLLWFLGVYIAVVALAPAMLRWHRRARFVALVALAGGVAVADLLRFGLDVPHVGNANVALAWLFAHQLGFWYADGSLLRGRRVGVFLALGGLGALVLLTAFGPYPVSMVGLPGEAVSNIAPPTLCVVALAVWQAGLVVLGREPVSRLLRRPAAWAVVVRLSAVIMTVYLWHLTALVVAAGALLGAGLPQPATGSAAWWALRPVWILLPLLVLAGLLVLVGRWERAGFAPAVAAVGALPRRTAVIAAVVLSTYALLGLSVVGLAQFATKTGRLVVVPVTPWSACLALLAAWVLLASVPRAAPR